MDNITYRIGFCLRNQRAQILLPAVLLAPIFILVVYLLFETAKVSMTKVRQQFALDNAAYAQMSIYSTYLNTAAMLNGPMPYRVLRDVLNIPMDRSSEEDEERTVFDIFYKAGAFPSIGKNYNLGIKGAISNPRPAPESNDWGFRYFGDEHKQWMKEDPSDDPNGETDEGKKVYKLTDKEMAEKYFFAFTSSDDKSNSAPAGNAIKQYISTYVYTGSTYASQEYTYKDNARNNRMFRQAYFLNTKDCKESECAKKSASTFNNFSLEAKRMEMEDLIFYISEVSPIQGKDHHNGSALGITLSMTDTIKAKLFQFAYLTPGSRNRLRKMGHGILLKQPYKLPANRFNINLEQRYKPHVRNTVYLNCPRENNNCVWPNPLPKYSVRVGV